MSRLGMGAAGSRDDDSQSEVGDPSMLPLVVREGEVDGDEVPRTAAHEHRPAQAMGQSLAQKRERTGCRSIRAFACSP